MYMVPICYVEDGVGLALPESNTIIKSAPEKLRLERLIPKYILPVLLKELIQYSKHLTVIFRENGTSKIHLGIILSLPSSEQLNSTSSKLVGRS